MASSSDNDTPRPDSMTVTKRGKAKLLLDGFAYVLDKTGRENVEYWRCEDREKCKARLTTDGRKIIKITGECTHAPDTA